MTSSSSGIMTANDPIVVKSTYLKPIPPDPEFENMKKGTNDYRTKVRSKMCLMCSNMAKTWVCYDVGSATFYERYCDNCIENRQLKENQVMDNFDDLFVRAESGTANYDKLHARNAES